ncbi:MAG: alpha/beta fold hydrolase [Rhodanobacter sp.]
MSRSLSIPPIAGRTAPGLPLRRPPVGGCRSCCWYCRSGIRDRVAAALAAAGRSVIAPDFRGHGRSGRAASHAPSDLVADMLLLLDRLRLSRDDLVPF